MNGATETRLLLLAIQPKTLADGERLETGLQQLAAEDPTLTVEPDRPTGTVTIGTIGELQLEIVVDRLRREFQVEASVGRPQVAYKDVPVQAADGTEAALVRLEPMMQVAVVVPREYGADVVADLSKRRGHVRSQESRDDRQIIHGVVPLAELFGYATDLEQRSRGRGTYSVQFDSYQPVRADPGPTDDDRNAPVGAPLRPVSPKRPDSIALPEPDDDGLDV